MNYCPHVADTLSLLLIMHSESTSTTSSGRSDHPAVVPTAIASTPFLITPADAEILSNHLEDFKCSSSAERPRCVERATAEVYAARAGGAPFSKKDAKKVRMLHLDPCKSHTDGMR